MRSVFPRFLVVVLMLLSVGHGGALLAAEAQQNFITVTGHGTLSVVPDRVEITIGVDSQANTAKAALDLNTANMNRIMAKLTENGVEKKQIQTSNFSIRPEYSRAKNAPPAIRGYRVENMVRVVLINVDQLGGLLDQLVASGSNRIHGIRFFVANEDQLKDEARRLAVKSAQRKATLYALAAGAKLGPVLSLVEGRHAARPPQPVARRMMAEAAPVPLSGGQQELGVAVTVTWALK